MQPTRNLALDSLPEPDRKAFLRVLRPMDLQQGQRLLDAAAPIEKVYFPIDAVVSLLVELSTGERIESAMIGHDGIVGTGAIVSGISICNAIVRLGGRCITAKHAS